MNLKFPEIQREFIVELSQNTLWKENSDDVVEAREYLQKQRKISDEVLKEYKFGYIPRRARHEWSERIIMPLYDPYGKLVVLTSRKFRSKDKYAHLHETFDKRYYLYGLNVAKPDIIKLNRCVIVEGQFDTTYLRTRGFKTVVGVLGSAFTFEHACILRRYCSEVYLVFDNDEAGKLTLERSLEMLATEKLEDTFRMSFIPVVLPKGYKDPDEYVQAQGPKPFRDLLVQAKIERNQFSLSREH
jgi:DNA primase